MKFLIKDYRNFCINLILIICYKIISKLKFRMVQEEDIETKYPFQHYLITSIIFAISVALLIAY